VNGLGSGSELEELLKWDPNILGTSAIEFLIRFGIICSLAVLLDYPSYHGEVAGYEWFNGQSVTCGIAHNISSAEEKVDMLKS
jgi:hypothetical protein